MHFSGVLLLLSCYQIEDNSITYLVTVNVVGCPGRSNANPLDCIGYPSDGFIPGGLLQHPFFSGISHRQSSSLSDLGLVNLVE